MCIYVTMGRLHVAPLPVDMAEDTLRTLASEYGNVKSIKLYEGYGMYALLTISGLNEIMLLKKKTSYGSFHRVRGRE